MNIAAYRNMTLWELLSQIDSTPVVPSEVASLLVDKAELEIEEARRVIEELVELLPADIYVRTRLAMAVQRITGDYDIFDHVEENR